MLNQQQIDELDPQAQEQKPNPEDQNQEQSNENENQTEQPNEEQIKYSKAVQKRMNELTFQWREEQRKSQALQGEIQEMKGLINTLVKQTDESVKENQQKDFEQKYAAAIEEGDNMKAAKIQGEYLKFIADKKMQEKAKQQPSPTSNPTSNPTSSDEHVAEMIFASQNQWYGKNKALTNAFIGIYYDLENESQFKNLPTITRMSEALDRLKTEFPGNKTLGASVTPPSGVGGVDNQQPTPKKRVVVTSEEIQRIKRLMPNKTDEFIRDVITKQKQQEAQNG